ncbi:hypothetical protein [Paenibacillus cremeus]|uniref:Uncharacterized protein n=1 Tax=Paenibacillus cremeus TaxID=2163881 RepID=A0A559K6P5_9BACL|nr:hypothetical protein [Paenibacillus cremeus]TVY07777.1 hypothetical protein FPZ49_22425 [Paenibacillus cremeus]
MRKRTKQTTLVAVLAAIVLGSTAIGLLTSKAWNAAAGVKEEPMEVQQTSAGAQVQSPPAASQAQGQGNGGTLIAAMTNNLLLEALYKFPTRLGSGFAPSGAVSVNSDWEQGKKGSVMYIEQQRYGADYVIAGLMTKKSDIMDTGMKVIQWGFDHQGANGGFPDTGDPFHSTEFFLEASSRAMLLLKQNGDPAYTETVAKYTPKISAVAHWMMLPEVKTRGNKNNAPYSHRRWADAAALGLTAELTGEQALAKEAEAYAREGLTLMKPDGMFPEKGAGDASYQGVGMLFAARFYYVCHDEELRGQVKEAVRKGLDWVLANMNDNGDIVYDNARTGVEAGRSGAIKTYDYKSLLFALDLASHMTGDSKYAEAAHKLALGRKWISG